MSTEDAQERAFVLSYLLTLYATDCLEDLGITDLEFLMLIAVAVEDRDPEEEYDEGEDVPEGDDDAEGGEEDEDDDEDDYDVDDDEEEYSEEDDEDNDVEHGVDHKRVLNDFYNTEQLDDEDEEDEEEDEEDEDDDATPAGDDDVPEDVPTKEVGSKRKAQDDVEAEDVEAKKAKA
ncbi:uncharacterized protein IL334_005722 [Kwoniella shivajii]|uniref:Uncharacterized protein n=1 Tax=Kwoniella shivajii TaxID=564305 RepID=A0ABZ1D7W8_9TREE|nr:hypothetical protein IL334_005722 [Kwoniella shivajii]